MEATAAVIGTVLTFAYNGLKYLIPGLTGKVAYWVFAGISFVLAAFLVILNGGPISWATFPEVLNAFSIIGGVALLIFNAIKFGPEVLTKAITGAIDTKKK